MCSNERITKYQFGLILANTFGFSTKLINPISIDEVPNLTLRPKDMSLVIINHVLIFKTLYLLSKSRFKN